jgi:hypothetical protein
MNSGALKVEALKRGVHETHGPHQREQSGLDMDAINGIDFLNPVDPVCFSQAAKLSPQEQCEVAFGLVTLKPPFCRSSLKSRVEPLTNNALFGSTTIRTLAE